MKRDTLQDIEKAALVVVAGVPPWMVERLQRLADLGTPEAELLRDWALGYMRDEHGRRVEFSPGAFGMEISAGGYDTEKAKEALKTVGISDWESLRDFEKGVETENRWAWGEIDEETYAKMNEGFQKRWAERLSEPEHSPKKRSAPSLGR